MPNVRPMMRQRSSKPAVRCLMAIFAFALFGGCASSTPESPKAPAPAPVTKPGVEQPAQGRTAAPSEPKREEGEPLLLLTEPLLLAELEKLGLAFSETVGERGLRANENSSLGSSTRYRSLADAIANDVAAVAQKDPQAGVSVARYSHRLFDARWLRSATAHFELAGVV